MRVWLEVNIKKLKNNIETLKKKIGNKKLIGVVKANSYNMGAVRITKELIKCGVDFFAVATIEEGIELRKNNIEENILVLGGVFNEELNLAEKYNLHIALATMEQLKYIKENKIDVKCHVKIETGMGRVGFSFNQLKELKEYIIKKNIKNVIGVYTHLSVSDCKGEENKKYTIEQIEKFNLFGEIDTIEYRHILNSGGILYYSDRDNGNYARAGIIQYGFCGEEKIKGYENIFKLKSKVLFIKTLDEDSDISYGRTVRLKKGDTIATIAAGYADGFKREISNKGKITINNVECLVVGKVCMDMFMAKLPDEIKENVKIGDEVILYGDNILEQAKVMNTTVYEIMTGIGSRVKRIYID